jgi:hypothetical protein
VLQCVWTFLSEPTNQVTIKWILSGAIIAGAGGISWEIVKLLWDVFKFWFDHRHKPNPQDGQDKQTPKSYAFFKKPTGWAWLATLLIIVTSSAYWIYDESRYYCTNCYASASIIITSPRDGETVSTSSSIRGKATPSQACRFVYVMARDLRLPKDNCKKDNNDECEGNLLATDLTQTLENGEWWGLLDMSHVGSNGSQVYAILTNQPMYKVRVPLTPPPVDGKPSKPMQLWRQ